MNIQLEYNQLYGKCKKKFVRVNKKHIYKAISKHGVAETRRLTKISRTILYKVMNECKKQN